MIELKEYPGSPLRRLPRAAYALRRPALLFRRKRRQRKPGAPRDSFGRSLARAQLDHVAAMSRTPGDAFVRRLESRGGTSAATCETVPSLASHTISSGTTVFFIQKLPLVLRGETKIIPVAGRKAVTHMRPSSRVCSSAATASVSGTALPLTPTVRRGVASTSLETAPLAPPRIASGSCGFAQPSAAGLSPLAVPALAPPPTTASNNQNATPNTVQSCNARHVRSRRALPIGKYA